MRKFFVAAVVAMSCVAMVSPAGAIIGGQDDAGRHPNVAVLDIAFGDGTRFAGCTGTLIAPTVVLTAAHCLSVADAPTIWVNVSFDERPHFDAAGFLDQPYIAATWISVHRQWNPALQDLAYDLGIVILERPVAEVWPGITPAQLPTVGYMDRYAKKGPKPLLEAVGYGVFDVPESGRPTYDFEPIARRAANLQFARLDGLLTMANQHHPSSANTGAICSGDSGGPLFDGNTLVGVVSFHRNERLRAWRGETSQAELHSASSFCEGWSGFPRLDSFSARSFLANFVVLP